MKLKEVSIQYRRLRGASCIPSPLNGYFFQCSSLGAVVHHVVFAYDVDSDGYTGDNTQRPRPTQIENFEMIRLVI